MLGYYLMLDPDGPQRKGLVIETVVTTRLLGRIESIEQGPGFDARDVEMVSQVEDTLGSVFLQVVGCLLVEFPTSLCRKAIQDGRP